MSDTLAIFSSGMWTLRPEIALLTGMTPVRARMGLAREAKAVAGWGHKSTADRARRAAAAAGLPYAAVEDGFLRSIRPGTGTRSFSYVVDWTGIYYDASAPSDLERLIVEAAAEPGISGDTLALLRRARLSKYNSGRRLGQVEQLLPKDFVLVVDQTDGDASVAGALASALTFDTMLQAALDRFGSDRTVVKVHPDVTAGLKRGYLFDRARDLGLAVLDRDVDPWDLFERCEAVFTVSSLIGLEALMAGVPVHCFGAPFYSGWGLTKDTVALPRRTARPTLAGLVEAAYGRYCRYIDPYFREASTLPNAVSTLSELKARFQSGPRFVTGGFSRWRIAAVEPFLDCAAGPPMHRRTIAEAEAEAKEGRLRLAVWGYGNDPVASASVRIEDGFLRSIGLGVEGAYPASLVLDEYGLYYDPGRLSGFEALANGAVLDRVLLERAAALRARIVAGRLSKYGVGRSLALPGASGRMRILVPGQVETDASIRLGAMDVRTNTDLLKAVRRQHPDAFILYKPHPDVVAGLRRGAVPKAVLEATADEAVLEASIADCLDWADRVETMTSLTGFEALLRGKAVAVHGRPFYGGWGLTEDVAPMPDRRQRRLTLDELVAVALILYPSYVDPFNRTPCPVEVVVRRLSEPPPVETGAARLERLVRTLRARILNRIAVAFPQSD
ncbi:capsular polysaccharide biosynthesis protein [Chthonobacter rhizosphaerae]|uniref:capsular polysaccharide biosynthesis protein n=1 Tax=Chthonobacter rhizosphaerae TaxID=2735553 RepID=UPI0015EF2177|nr:capsular polysaccharide biosynthesis protein [Chthonobacter rhizosphaerae]